MNAASGETEVGGERSALWFATEDGMSLETLGDLVARGDGYPVSNLDVGVPTTSEGAIAGVARKSSAVALSQCLMCVYGPCVARKKGWSLGGQFAQEV